MVSFDKVFRKIAKVKKELIGEFIEKLKSCLGYTFADNADKRIESIIQEYEARLKE